jgi:hypothetical protein
VTSLRRLASSSPRRSPPRRSTSATTSSLDASAQLTAALLNAGPEGRTARVAFSLSGSQARSIVEVYDDPEILMLTEDREALAFLGIITESGLLMTEVAYSL